MSRRLHAFLGLVLIVPLLITAVSGGILAVDPVVQRVTGPAIENATTTAALAGAVAARHEVVDKITVKPTGEVLVTYSDGDTRGVERVDPRTGAGLGPYQPSATTQFIIDLHRAFLSGDMGRNCAALCAFAMLLLSITGLRMTARRLGGWGSLLRPIRGPLANRLHGELARAVVVALLFSSITGLAMSAETFGLVGGDATVEAAAPASSGAPAAPLASLTALRALPLGNLHELTFPDPEDRTGVFHIATRAGEGDIDPGTGALLDFTPLSTTGRVLEAIRDLHTGRSGAWPLGLLLGVGSLAVPVLAGTGAAIWTRRRRASAGAEAGEPVSGADTIILVGSAGGSTRVYAETLRRGLKGAGYRAHVADMNAVAEEMTGATRWLVLASTAGDGEAPDSATRFIERLRTLSGAKKPTVAVLGFGDSTFPKFLGFARAAHAALTSAGYPELLPFAGVDRQSDADYQDWHGKLEAALGARIRIGEGVRRPGTLTWKLVSREEYGAAIGARAAVLRFETGTMPRFDAGDLIGVIPGAGAAPRFYSLASSSTDGFLEICVRLREGGVCSTLLHELPIGGAIEAFVRRNPRFHPVEGPAPLILIGAGAGIAPLAGFARANREERPVHLYWGGRDPESDFLYERELNAMLADRRLTSLNTAFSRITNGGYVQDRLVADAARLRLLIARGAQILVCGGREMASSVAQTLETAVLPMGIDLGDLKSRGRYVEDVY